MSADVIPFDPTIDEKTCSMNTFTGRSFSLSNPRPEDVDIVDIAVALSRIPRFTGHTRVPYCVATHSRLASELCPLFALPALMHDAAEAYTNDISKPMKYVIGYKRISAIEHKIHCAIAKRFGFISYMPAEVKRTDNMLLRTEQRDLMGRKPKAGEETFESTIEPELWWNAMQGFLARFEELAAAPINWSAVPSSDDFDWLPEE